MNIMSADRAATLVSRIPGYSNSSVYFTRTDAWQP